ncbi:MAG: hypothetical protein GY730_03690 [bacterium]|nr:hypothetical protein [bacterium]
MHWTYEEYSKEDDLCQGDILEPIDKLKALFENILPNFTESHYRGFFLLTQSCDMARRDSGEYKATHINLAAIYSLQDVINNILKKDFACLIPGVYFEYKKKTFKQTIQRLINQNEKDLGLFYLHKDADSGIAYPSAVILSVPISVRANEYYEILQEARMGRLSKEFQAKLGWMVGYLYSRVGVHDWKEEGKKNKDVDLEKKIMGDIINSLQEEEPLWIENRIYKNIKKKYPWLEILSTNDQKEIINRFLPPPLKDEIVKIVVDIIKNAIKIKDNDLKNIETRLMNNPRLKAQVKRVK